MGRACVFAVVLAALTARAAEPCAKSGLVLFPAPGAVVPTNVQFLLEGVGESQALVQELLKAQAIALVGKGDVPAVQVKAEKGFVSQMNRVVVRLRPLKSLLPDTEYVLALPPNMTGVHLINDAVGDGALRWLTGPGADKVAPRYKQKPASSEGVYEQTPEGLTRKLRLRAVVQEAGPAYLLVTMQRARGGSARQQYPVTFEGAVLTLGHDACSGNFGFDDGRAYRLTFELFDAAGNRSPEKATLEVAAPRPLGQ